jgi:hypothetical protein
LQFSFVTPAARCTSETQLLIAQDLGYSREEGTLAMEELIAETGKMLNGLIHSMRPKAAERSGPKGIGIIGHAPRIDVVPASGD